MSSSVTQEEKKQQKVPVVESKQKNISDSDDSRGHRHHHKHRHHHYHRNHSSRERQRQSRDYSQSKQDPQRRSHRHHSHHSRHHKHQKHRDYSRERSSDRYYKGSKRDSYSSRYPRRHSKYSDNQEQDRHSKRPKQDRRKQRLRTRSPHPLIGKRQKPTKYHQYLQQQKRSDRQHAQEFWDGFQWVKKTDANPQAAPGSSFGISGDPSRNLKIHVTGLPTDLGITAQDVREYFNQQILKNHPPIHKKSDQDAAFAKLSPEEKQLPKQLLIQLGKIPPDIIVQKQIPVVEVQLMPQLNAATIEFSQPKMTSHAKQLNGNKILGQTLRIHGFAEQIKFQNKHLVQLAAQRGIHAVIGQHNVGMSNQTTATATALALAAVKGLQGNDVNINMQALGMTAATSTASKIIKIFNICDRDQILPQNEYNQIREDMVDEMKQFTGLVDIYVVKPGKEKLGMQRGSIFVEFNNIESAQSALNLMKGRTFDNRRVKAIYIPLQLWKNELSQH